MSGIIKYMIKKLKYNFYYFVYFFVGAIYLIIIGHAIKKLYSQLVK